MDINGNVFAKQTQCSMSPYFLTHIITYKFSLIVLNETKRWVTVKSIKMLFYSRFQLKCIQILRLWLSQMLALSLTFATPLCWKGPSGHYGWSWTVLTKCGYQFIGPGDSMSATMGAWQGLIRQKRLPSTERLRWKSGDARLISLPPKWAQITATTLSSVR